MIAPIPLWWRDDDATEDTPELRRLLEIQREWRAALSLAVIPEYAKASLFAVTDMSDVEVLVHGFAHRNQAPPGSRKAEFTSDRSLVDMRSEWIAGYERLGRLCRQTLPVFVPPWNRFPHEYLVELGKSGYAGFSAWGPEGDWPAPEGMTVANVQIDVIDWRNGLTAKTAGQLLGEFEKLMPDCGKSGPQHIGILTHHRQMSDAAFSALEDVFRHLSGHRAIVWSKARSIFRIPE